MHLPAGTPALNLLFEQTMSSDLLTNLKDALFGRKFSHPGMRVAQPMRSKRVSRTIQQELAADSEAHLAPLISGRSATCLSDLHILPPFLPM